MQEFQLVQSDSALTGVLDRKEFIEEFHYRYQPGQHVIMLGPTGRGKTTLASQILSYRDMPKTRGLLVTQIGPDDPLKPLGKPVNSWPPQLLSMQLYDHEEAKTGRPFIRRYEPMPKKPEHFMGIRRQNSRILRWMFARPGWALFIPDMQILSDPGMMGLGKEIDQLVITLRKRKSSMWMDTQAARWIPRSSTDNTQHLLIWRNRDEDSVERLSKIAGVNKNYMLSMLKGIGYHDCVWVDVTADEFFIVRSK